MASSNKNFNNIIQPLLVDKYQVSMCYAYWNDNQHEKYAVFDLFFRKNPFKGEYTIFAGLDACLKFVQNYSISQEDISFLKSQTDFNHIQEAFWDYMAAITTNAVKLYALQEGCVCFPTMPLIRVEGPIAILQLLETPLLTLTNYPSLITTNAARYRLALTAGQKGANKCQLFEFGLRRAQGPDGGFSASKHAYMGGFDATSNLLAGKVFDIPVSGTMGHAYIISYFGNPLSLKDHIAGHKFLHNKLTFKDENFTKCCLEFEEDIANKRLFRQHSNSNSNESEKSELQAFISYAHSFPEKFLALVDTYDVLKSGLVNFSIVALALLKFGYTPIGIRIDSGDLAYLSRVAKDTFGLIASAYDVSTFSNFEIVASNDINEEIINSLNDQEHYITCMGIGTHLVTCQNQAALGCVYKLVEIDGKPCMKLSSVSEKVSIPGRKSIYRLFGRDGHALLDLLALSSEPPPQAGQRLLCFHPFVAEKRTYVTPKRVEPLLELWWAGKATRHGATLEESRSKVKESLELLTDDIKRSLNATPYKVSVSSSLLNLLNDLKQELTPIGELL